MFLEIQISKNVLLKMWNLDVLIFSNFRKGSFINVKSWFNAMPIFQKRLCIFENVFKIFAISRIFCIFWGPYQRNSGALWLWNTSHHHSCLWSILFRYQSTSMKSSSATWTFELVFGPVLGIKMEKNQR